MTGARGTPGTVLGPPRATAREPAVPYGDPRRPHLRRVFAKTGVGSRAELVTALFGGLLLPL